MNSAEIMSVYVCVCVCLLWTKIIAAQSAGVVEYIDCIFEKVGKSPLTR